MPAVRAVKCIHCGDIIYSSYRHDYVNCSCGMTFVDGGKDYIRTNAKETFVYEVEEK